LLAQRPADTAAILLLIAFAIAPVMACDLPVTNCGPGSEGALPTAPAPATTKVFLILMENHDWADIKGSPSAPYTNGLLALGAHAEQYYSPFGIHPSEPNYLWLEAGQAFGVRDSNGVAINHQRTSRHLTALLRAANISWRSYQEDIPGTECPLTELAGYVPRHNPNVFFDDNTGDQNPGDAFCIAHNRPYAELAADLASDAVPRFVFVTPNLCDTSHDSCAPLFDPIRQADDWLSHEVPKILASPAYQHGAYVFIAWDESETTSGPIGLIALSQNAKVGYANALPYTHSSTLRSLQEIFGVGPLLGDAVNATDLGDLFASFP
jgi:hypothetical protein